MMKMLVALFTNKSFEMYFGLISDHLHCRKDTQSSCAVTTIAFVLIQTKRNAFG